MGGVGFTYVRRIGRRCARLIRGNLCSESMLISDVIYFAIDAVCICEAIRAFLVPVTIACIARARSSSITEANKMMTQEGCIPSQPNWPAAGKVMIRLIDLILLPDEEM